MYWDASSPLLFQLSLIFKVMAVQGSLSFVSGQLQMQQNISSIWSTMKAAKLVMFHISTHGKIRKRDDILCLPWFFPSIVNCHSNPSMSSWNCGHSCNILWLLHKKLCVYLEQNLMLLSKFHWHLLAILLVWIFQGLMFVKHDFSRLYTLISISAWKSPIWTWMVQMNLNKLCQPLHNQKKQWNLYCIIFS